MSKKKTAYPHWDALRAPYNAEVRRLIAKGRTWRETQMRITLDKMLGKELKILTAETKATKINFVERDASFRAHFQAAKQSLDRITQIINGLEVEHERALKWEADSPHPDGLPQEFEPVSTDEDSE